MARIALRTYYMFLGPFEAMKPWDSKGIMGVHRFLNRIWRIAVNEGNVTDLSRITDATPSPALDRFDAPNNKESSEDIETASAEHRHQRDDDLSKWN